MANNFQRGDLVPVLYQALGAAPQLLNIEGHNLDIECLLVNTTHSGTQGITARLASTIDANGTFKLSFDLDNPFYGPMQLVPGRNAVAAWGVNAAQTRFIQVPVVVGKVGTTSAREGKVENSCELKCNYFAGLFVYPPVP